MRFWRARGARLVVGLLAAVLAASVAVGSAVGAPAQQVRAAAIFSIPNPASVNGWDKGQFLGSLVLINRFGWRLATAEDVPFPRLAETAASYAEAGYDVVVFTSSGHIGAWNEVAPRYPRTWFVLMSTVDRLPSAPRVAAFNPDLFTYGAMAGATAALASKSGKIAGIGGVAVFGNLLFMSGVIEGARAVRPDAEVTVSYSGSWVDVPKAREVAALAIRRGADIIVVNAGPSTKGVFEAAESAKVWTVGYATDWYQDSPSSVLASLLLNIDRWYTLLGTEYAAGRLERKIYNIGPEMFGLSDFRGKLPPAQESRIRDVVGRIQRGELKVPYKFYEIR
ncbi:MAG: BMP family ABC transporter substrate-binding protein [Armatimonadota bacterium]|nr:BMP family ABC transporter substrate-binding protein [Armatimonadota bacterium]